MSSQRELFGDEEFLRTLAYLDLKAKQILSSSRRGERRSSRSGAGTLFKDHRSYSYGDDPRYVDWNVYGRLGTLFVKEFEVEDSAEVLLLVDCSKSMGFGKPSKLSFAKRVGAALGYIGLAHLDRVRLVGAPGTESASFSGKAQAPLLFDRILALEAAGGTDLLASTRHALGGSRRRGLAVLVSDLFDPKGYRPAVDFLRHRRQQVFVIQVYAPDEAGPSAGGRLQLVDSETGRRRNVFVTEAVATAYAREFERFCDTAERYAKAKEIGYARFSSDTSFGRAVLSLLRRGAVIR